MTETDLPSRAGSQFGHYRLIKLLGRGAMGEVYQAEDTRKRRIVALKLISQQYSGNPEFRERMQREADTAGRLTEPHVVPIHDYGEIDGQFYVDMRLIEGIDLRGMLNRYGPMNPARAVAIVRQIAAALDAAHDAGVIHRDVKPENILLTSHDFAYLVDFGVARARTDAGLTQPGTTVGTYHYMAPERFTKGEVTDSVDVYSLACVLHECLTASHPFRANSIERLITAHLMDPIPRPSQLRPDAVPPALDDVVARGMAKKPEDRYRRPSELASAAYDALTAHEQHQAAKILQHSKIATLPRGVDPGGAGATQMARQADPQTTPFKRGDPDTVRQNHPLVPTAFSPPTWTDQGQSRPHIPTHSNRPTAAPSQPRVPTGGPQGRHPSDPEMTTRAFQRPGIPTGVAPVGPPRTPAFGGPPAPPRPVEPGPQPRQDGKRKRLLIIGAAALVAVLVVAGGIGYWATRPDKAPAAQPWNLAAGQAALPFDQLNFPVSPGGVAVDGAGNVYATSQLLRGKVVKLAPGESSPVVLPFTGLYQPHGLAVDAAGSVYVTDFNRGVSKLAAGSNSPMVLPFTDVPVPEGVAVDASGTTFVADRGGNRVLKLAPGATSQTVLPFADLKHPVGMAVGDDGSVYVADSDNRRVLKLPPNATAQEVLPFTGLTLPWGEAVDKKSNVYVTDHDSSKVMKLPPGATSSTEVALTGINTPLGIAVDGEGNVYIADRGNNRVVRLAA